MIVASFVFVFVFSLVLVFVFVLLLVVVSVAGVPSGFWVVVVVGRLPPGGRFNAPSRSAIAASIRSNAFVILIS